MVDPENKVLPALLNGLIYSAGRHCSSHISLKVNLQINNHFRTTCAILTPQNDDAEGLIALLTCTAGTNVENPFKRTFKNNKNPFKSTTIYLTLHKSIPGLLP